MAILTLCLCALLLVACVRRPSLRGGAVIVDWAPPELGVAVDANQQVVVVLRNSAAARAGIQAGDILLDMRALSGGSENSPASEAIPISDLDQIRALFREGFRLEERAFDGETRPTPVAGPFLLRLQRGDVVIELEIEAGPTYDYTAPDPTPTAGDPDLKRL